MSINYCWVVAAVALFRNMGRAILWSVSWGLELFAWNMSRAKDSTLAGSSAFAAIVRSLRDSDKIKACKVSLDISRKVLAKDRAIYCDIFELACNMPRAKD